MHTDVACLRIFADACGNGHIARGLLERKTSRIYENLILMQGQLFQSIAPGEEYLPYLQFVTNSKSRYSFFFT